MHGILSSYYYKQIVLVLCLFSIVSSASAQCTNWKVSPQLITTSLCGANGSFSAIVSGADAANLSNLQFGIPVNANGFSVPLNNSASFSSIPPGTYTVSCVATCGTNVVGKNATVTIPGAYVAPNLVANMARGSINCGAYGRIAVSVMDGRAPFTIKMINVPAGYTGPVNFSSTSPYYTINSLPAGNYTIQVIDACGSSPAPKNVTVNSIALSTIGFNYTAPLSPTCDTVLLPKPYIQTGSGWYGYDYDTLFKVSAQITNIIGATPFENIYSGVFRLRLPPGKKIKDCYGQTINYTVKPPCGANFTVSTAIPYPTVSATIDQNCNIDFKATLSFTGMICYPLTYTLHNIATATNYGPFTTSSATIVTQALPVGSYTINFTTADGYNGTGNIVTTPISGNPYSVSILTGAPGLNNYIDGFNFSTSATALSSRTIELFNGPAGYSYSVVWTGGNNFVADYNQTPLNTNSMKFPAGNYVWKITDKCGSYYIPVTVGAQQLYQFTAGISKQKQTCQGLWVWPAGTATNNGNNVPVKFSFLLNGYPLTSPFSSAWPQYLPGDSVLLTTPGNYTVVPSAEVYTYFIDFAPYPNVYSNTFSFNYTVMPAEVDINNSQGFLCIGAATGQGQIYAKGKGGIPYASPVHYIYSLAANGNGLSGPYIATNTTGIFTNFGATANALYDVKITDSCGGFAMQSLKILDLKNIRLISSSDYVACKGNDVQLSVAFFPGATYSWTGPNGFTSSLRTPLITNIGSQNAGLYKVTVAIPACSQSVTDSTLITLNGNPAKPLVSLQCSPPPVSLTVTNPSSGYQYKWQIDVYTPTYNFQLILPSDVGYTKYVTLPASYRAIATDTTTGCSSLSDSVYFGANPNSTINAMIYSPHLQICTGDTTILVAQGSFLNATYQWFKNGAVIPGATQQAYITNVAGSYKVRIQTGPCSIDTSAEVTVNIVSYPTATISAAAKDICAGDTTNITAGTGSGYSYTWHRNNTTIPGITSSLLHATQSGSYFVTVSNGGCVATSAPVQITSHTAPVVNITPNTDQVICKDSSAVFQTPADPSFTYTWLHNGIPIVGANADTYAATTAGTYMVTVGSAFCPSVTSTQVKLSLLPVAINLGNDTFICDGIFTIPLSVDTGFSRILWSTGQVIQQINATQRGIYWVEAGNKCGLFSDTIHIHTLTDFLPTLPDDTTICNKDNSAVFSVTAIADHITWSTGDTIPSITVTRPAVYSVKVESACGIFYDSVQVNFCSPVITNIIPERDSICEGDCISFTASLYNYPQQYSWTFDGGIPATANTESPGIVCYNKEGVYPVTLTVTNAGGSSQFVRNFSVFSIPKRRFADTAITLSYKSRIIMPACADAFVADWYKDGALVCAGCPGLPVEGKDYQSVYHCVVRNSGCTDSCTYQIQVIDIPHDLWLPDAFSPNGDGHNDLFRIITDNPNIRLLDLSVYSRWGERYFSTETKERGWDGNYHGSPVEIGTYFWSVHYKVLGSEEEYFKKGDVVLIR